MPQMSYVGVFVPGGVVTSAFLSLHMSTSYNFNHKADALSVCDISSNCQNDSYHRSSIPRYADAQVPEWAPMFTRRLISQQRRYTRSPCSSLLWKRVGVRRLIGPPTWSSPYNTVCSMNVSLAVATPATRQSYRVFLSQ